MQNGGLLASAIQQARDKGYTSKQIAQQPKRMALTSVTPRFAHACPARTGTIDDRKPRRRRNRPQLPCAVVRRSAIARDNGARGRAGAATPAPDPPRRSCSHRRPVSSPPTAVSYPPRIPTIFNPTGGFPACHPLSHPIPFISSAATKAGRQFMVSVALVHHLAQRGTAPLVDRNRHLQSRCLAVLRTRTGDRVSIGWTRRRRRLDHASSICAKRIGSHLVINTAARNNTGIARHGDIPNGAVQELNRASSRCGSSTANGIRWRCSNGFCRPFLTATVLRPAKFGTSATRRNRAEPTALRQTLEAARRPVVDFPDLADRVADDLISRRLSVARALRELPPATGPNCDAGKGGAATLGRSPNSTRRTI